jgi:hypothetical protein
MKKTFQDVLRDIEQNLIGKQLSSISGNAALFSISEIDYENSNVVLNVQEKRRTWTFDRMERVWNEMYYRPAANVEIVFGGSGSSRNQVETIYASMAYVEWLYVNSKKCVAYVGEETHQYGTLKHMDEAKEKQYQALMSESNPRNPLLDPDEDLDISLIDNPKQIEQNPLGIKSVSFITGYRSSFERNRILFGAPGTGKSFTLNHEKDVLLAEGGEYERVTFHPDYSYANFVGTYKPVPCKDSDGKDAITYSYVPGPFMRTYVKALQNSRTDTPKPFLLVIEEINRANVAAVFGDVFQLLDRGDDEVSEYPIQASEDIKKYLAGELGGNPSDYAEIRIPDNMFIWATMNSADQGVFPMDTAFKRRWDFTYLGIDDSETGIVGKKVVLGQGEYRRVIEWNALRKAINNELLTYKVNEDKLMGPYFIAKKNLPEGEEIDPVVFARIFKNKVIMYLFDDAAKQKRITLFGGCDEKAKNQYSKICREFDTKGVYIFCEGISSQFVDNIPEDNGV